MCNTFQACLCPYDKKQVQQIVSISCSICPVSHSAWIPGVHSTTYVQNRGIPWYDGSGKIVSCVAIYLYFSTIIIKNYCIHFRHVVIFFLSWTIPKLLHNSEHSYCIQYIGILSLWIVLTLYLFSSFSSIDHFFSEFYDFKHNTSALVYGNIDICFFAHSLHFSFIYFHCAGYFHWFFFLSMISATSYFFR